MTLVYTPLYAFFLTLLYLLLSFMVIRGRWKYRTALGEGTEETMQKLVRIHGNFSEYVPLGLILLLLAELQNAPANFLHWCGGFLLAGRIGHVFGLLKSRETSLGRIGGMLLTFLSLALLMGYQVYAFQFQF